VKIVHGPGRMEIFKKKPTEIKAETQIHQISSKMGRKKLECF